MIPTVSESKKVNGQKVYSGRSSGIANTSDGVQNVIGGIDINGESNAGNFNHRAVEYVTSRPPTSSDYPGAPIGSVFHEFSFDSAQNTTAVYDYKRYVKTANGIIKESGNSRIRMVKTWGSTDSQYDVTLPGNSIVRYTYDGTGSAPAFVAGGLKVGDKVTIGSGDFSAANQGTFTVVTVAATYFEVENASGVAESNIVTDGSPITSYLTVETNDDIILVNNTADTTVTLPTASGIRGKIITVKNLSTGVVTVDGYSSETIEGSATVKVYGANDFLTIVSDGTNWLKVASSRNDMVFNFAGTTFDTFTLTVAKMTRAGKVSQVMYFTSGALGSGVGIDIVDGGTNGAGTDVICSCVDNLNGLETDSPSSANVLSSGDYLNIVFDNVNTVNIAIDVRFVAGCDV